MVTADTNIAFYALTEDAKTRRAEQALAECRFLSAQVLNEFANASRRKRGRDWCDIKRDLELLRAWVDDIRSVGEAANAEAVRLAERYELAFYDAVLIAVALANGASVLYSEDMHHGLVIDGKLTIINPFHQTDPA